MKGTSGVSIIELLAAVAIVSILVSMMSLLFPASSKNILRNRQHMSAANLAAAKMEELMKEPYAYLVVTSSVAANFPTGRGTADPGCQCSKDINFSNLTAQTDVIPSTGTIYTRSWCINFITYS